ncbi:MAG: PEP-CTERM sorting domain-containing protein [Alphaproteobacteria bacterium]|nr:PEP-CTERM sorting domain-containing protein [Alphaproteobacteria bacterium]
MFDGAAVPEPAGVALLLAGIAGIILVRRSAASASAPVLRRRQPASVIP